MGYVLVDPPGDYRQPAWAYPLPSCIDRLSEWLGVQGPTWGMRGSGR